MTRLLHLITALSLLLVLLAGAVFFAGRQRDSAMTWVEHTQQVLRTEGDLRSTLQEMNLSSRGYALSKNEDFRRLFDAAEDEFAVQAQKFGNLTSDSAAQQEALKKIQQKAKVLIEKSEIVWSAAVSAQLNADLKAKVTSQKRTMDELRTLLSSVVAEEERLLRQRQPDAARAEKLFNVLIACAFITALALIFAIRASLTRYRKEQDGQIAKLQEARDQAIAANEAKTRFLSTVSHEVRTPMAGVIGLVELIHASAIEPPIKTMANTALDSCKRLLQILNDLLDASKLQAGKVDLEYRSFSIRPIIGDVVQLVTPEASKKGLSITSTVGADVPNTLCGDELRVRQILQNLMFNAVKFTEKGEVHVQVDFVAKDSTRTAVKLSVSDTGIGLTEEQKKKLFEPFVQGADSTTRVHGGTGLGLHICRTLTELMRGEIGVDSEPGNGSTFWVLIPFDDSLCQNPR